MGRTKGAKPTFSKNNFDSYKKSALGFAKIDNYSIGMQEVVMGMGCCVSLDKSTHIFVMAPDSDKLQDALDELRITKDERSHPDVSLVALYPARFLSEQEIKNLEAAERKKKEDWKKGLEIIWVYHNPSDVVCMIWRKDLGTDDFEELGDAIKKTEIEARLLCRSAGWKIENAKAVEVSLNDPDNEIPF